MADAIKEHALSSQMGDVRAWKTLAVASFLLALAFVTFTLQIASLHVKRTKRCNRTKRRKLIEKLDNYISKSNEEVDKSSNLEKKVLIGFFHPYCNAGGGGERVLWQAVEHHLKEDANIIVVVYSGDVGPEQVRLESTSETSGQYQPTTKEDILDKCYTRFGIPLQEPQFSARIHFLPLTKRVLVSDGYWKHFTLLGQSYGAARMAFEACNQLLPDIFIDTMGYAFAYPVVRLFDHNIPIGAYVHYPMISADMLYKVRNRISGHTNLSTVSNSSWKSQAKSLYYLGFVQVYAWALRRSNVIVTNGSWTQNHINTLIGADASSSRFSQIVYPPCDTTSLRSFALNDRQKYSLVSLAQFRPEKEHKSQLIILAELIRRRQQKGLAVEGLTLTCIGSCRNDADEKRIHSLKELSQELQIEDQVHFVVNASYATILQTLSAASIGLSTMVDEHFGINVVEFMAAGLITVSHASAGPYLDIAVQENNQPTGFHATTIGDFATTIEKILELSEEEDLTVRQRARKRATSVFSNEAFCRAWQEKLWEPLVSSHHRNNRWKKQR